MSHKWLTLISETKGFTQNLWFDTWMYTNRGIAQVREDMTERWDKRILRLWKQGRTGEMSISWLVIWQLHLKSAKKNVRTWCLAYMICHSVGATVDQNLCRIFRLNFPWISKLDCWQRVNLSVPFHGHIIPSMWAGIRLQVCGRWERETWLQHHLFSYIVPCMTLNLIFRWCND